MTGVLCLIPTIKMGGCGRSRDSVCCIRLINWSSILTFTRLRYSLPLRLVLLFSLILSLTSQKLAAQTSANENQFGASLTLFTTMAAINAAGYDADLNSPANYPIREQIRAELAKRDIPILPELKRYYQDHRKGTDTATLSQYVSFALLAGSAPDFKLDTHDLPPDVEPLITFSELLSRFYKEANIAGFVGEITTGISGCDKALPGSCHQCAA